tara:strand:+ start:173 stop:436 length:264 start_codon:yes stop_codon:yes gene_type:complete
LLANKLSLKTDKMKNYLTEIELDKSKTYYSYVDVAVEFDDKDTWFMEKLPSNKKEMNSIIKMLNPKNSIKNIEIIRKTFRLKDKWLS